MSEKKHHRLSPLEPLTVVSLEDPALDYLAMGPQKIREYAETRDESSLVFRPGMTPTRYRLRPLSRAALTRYVNRGTAEDDERYQRALACSLEEVTLPVDAATGEQRPVPWKPAPGDVLESEQLGCSIISDAAIEAVVHPYGAIAELGKVAYERAYLHPKAPAAFSAQPGSLRRIAAALQRAATTTQSPPSSDPTPRPEQP